MKKFFEKFTVRISSGSSTEKENDKLAAVRSRTFIFAGWLFLKCLGLIYLIAFISLAVQIKGLAGSQGILPASDFLRFVHERLKGEGYWQFPTLAWLNSSDPFLQFLCWGGAFLAVLLILDFAPVLVLFLLWVFYLSLVHVGQDFLSFQWDILLLEAGFLAIFLAPFRIWPAPLRHRNSPPKLTLWLFRWLLFRLIFSSGVVKLSSGDLVWRNLTALNYHYETQPLPTWIGWYAHHLPAWFQKFSCAGMFFCELVVPFLFFAPRRLRYFACAFSIALQCLIGFTGNYCFFNLLTVSLCLLLLDDSVWPNLSLKRDPPAESPAARSHYWPKWILAPVSAILILASLFPLIRSFRARIVPLPIAVLYETLQPLNIVNPYGLFAVMTTSRPEIIIEGSQDGETWSAYEFKWKAGDLARKPAFVEPHQPRLDWQMWFAALSNYHYNSWFISFMKRLLEDSPDVIKLLAKNPFPDNPPRYLRAVLFDYHFADLTIQRNSGLWWSRTRQGFYCPVLTLQDGQLAVAKNVISS